MHYEKSVEVAVKVSGLREWGVVSTEEALLAPSLYYIRKNTTHRRLNTKNRRLPLKSIPIIVSISEACLILFSSVDVARGVQIKENHPNDHQLRGGGNQYVFGRRDQTSCAPPSGGCGNGIWSENSCQCMCVPPYCYDDLFQSCVKVTCLIFFRIRS